jgi:hypothetical protein
VRLVERHDSSANCHKDVATDRRASTTEIRKASRARAPDSPMPGECMGEGGCLFDEIGKLVEPTERPHTDVRAGPQRGRTPKRRGTNSPANGEQQTVYI